MQSVLVMVAEVVTMRLTEMLGVVVCDGNVDPTSLSTNL